MSKTRAECYDVPEEDRQFTTGEIAEIAGVTINAVLNWRTRLNVGTRHNLPRGWAVTYTYSEMKQIVDSIERIRAEKAKARERALKAQEEKKGDLEELSREHPLVKDKRFLIVGTFPSKEEITP